MINNLPLFKLLPNHVLSLSGIMFPNVCLRYYGQPKMFKCLLPIFPTTPKIQLFSVIGEHFNITPGVQILYMALLGTFSFFLDSF